MHGNFWSLIEKNVIIMNILPAPPAYLIMLLCNNKAKYIYLKVKYSVNRDPIDYQKFFVFCKFDGIKILYNNITKHLYVQYQKEDYWRRRQMYANVDLAHVVIKAEKTWKVILNSTLKTLAYSLHNSASLIRSTGRIAIVPSWD